MNKTNTGANTNVLDMLLDMFVLLMAYGLDVIIVGRGVQMDTFVSLSIYIAIFGLIFLLSNKEEYLYNITLFYYLDRIHRKITKSFFIATMPTAIAVYFVINTEEARRFYISFLFLAYVFICIKMFFARTIMNLLLRERSPRTVFVGKIGQFNKFSYFLKKTNIHMQFLGYIAMTKEEYKDGKVSSYIGCLDDLESLIREYNIDQVYIMQKHGEELPFIQSYVDLCIDMGVTIRLIIDFYKRRKANSYVSTVGTYPIVTYHTVSLNTYEQLLKRMMDIVGGAIGVVVFSPIMLAVAFAIKMDSPGNALFKQTRVGQNGRNFQIYKFRSMYVDAELRKQELLDQNEMKGGVMFKIKDDPRITRVGKVIRRLSIDELPQFFNVIQGSMSLVGTRPPTIDEIEKYERSQWRRISIKPGLTGMWQVSGRSSITEFDDIVEMDVDYIDSWSLLLDIKIICKTALVLLNQKGAY